MYIFCSLYQILSNLKILVGIYFNYLFIMFWIILQHGYQNTCVITRDFLSWKGCNVADWILICTWVAVVSCPCWCARWRIQSAISVSDLLCRFIIVTSSLFNIIEILLFVRMHKREKTEKNDVETKNTHLWIKKNNSCYIRTVGKIMLLDLMENLVWEHNFDFSKEES